MIIVELTIDDYINQCFTIRSVSDFVFGNIQTDNLKKDIITIYHEVSNRMKFSIPINFINSYDVSSCIVSFDPDNGHNFYHIIDLAMFGYFHKFLKVLEQDVPNYAVFAYRLLRKDVYISKSDIYTASLYSPPVMYVNEHDVEVESLSHVFSEEMVEKYKCMIRFYFLHEYMHYLYANPIRESSNKLIDIIIESFFKSLDDKSNSRFNSRFGKQLQKCFYENSKSKWYNDPDFREEIYCDFQSIFCLLELPGATNGKIGVDIMFDSVLSYVYINHVIYIAKHLDSSIETFNQFSFRQNILAYFAYLMEDKEFAQAICSVLKSNNRFFVQKELQCNRILFKKYENFYFYFCKIFESDLKKEIKDGKYVFPFFIQPKYKYTFEFLKENDIPEWFVN